jgi:hypothetical protein
MILQADLVDFQDERGDEMLLVVIENQPAKCLG